MSEILIRSVCGILACAALACGQDISPAEKAKLAALAPGKTEPHFYLSNLFEYIDGGADVYLQYGLAGMVHQEYRAGDTDITTDIYDMGDALHAFGMYAAERSPDYQFIPMGAEGYSNDGMLNFLRGRYYVKLLGFSDSGKSAIPLEAAARAISLMIGGSRALPQPAPWLPQRGMVEHSQKYLVKVPLGEFLGPAATAVYRFDGQETTLLVSAAPGAVSQLKAAYHGTPAAGLPVVAWRGTSPYEGELLFFARAGYTIVLIHPPAHPEVFLQEIIRGADTASGSFEGDQCP
jgi:hypothetical protein